MSQSTLLIGLESVGKSALFRSLTGQATGDEQNFRGSTVRVRTAELQEQATRLIDTPGIRVQDDSETTRLALSQIGQADTVVLVARATHATAEIATLLAQLRTLLAGHKATLILTFADKQGELLPTAVAQYQERLGIPVTAVNARNMSAEEKQNVWHNIHTAVPLTPPTSIPLPLIALPVIQPQTTPYEHPRWGAWLSVFTLLALFALPVYLAYHLADWVQPIADAAVIEPLVNWFAPLAQSWPFLHAILVGDYGVITLGWYSFLWAFPVVVLIGVSVAITEEIGLKERITASLDPWLRLVGLNGRDLVPVLSGFGCNVVAVFQTRACSRCTREACVSLIAFGSACSYQIGASLSLFNVAGRPSLFFPYLGMLFVVGAIHTRLWHKPLADGAAMPLSERAFLQRPTMRGVQWRLAAVLQQFLWQAMPIFLLMCVVGAALAYVGVLDVLAEGMAPLMGLFGLPGWVAPGVIFAILRKDGLLVLNQGEGAQLASLTTGQLFVLVYLASTFTACLVTLWTVRRELGWGVALKVAGRQMGTAVVSAFLLGLVV